jgi:3-(3-hydroxy-phenyl)propionate hydroxylase
MDEICGQGWRLIVDGRNFDPRAVENCPIRPSVIDGEGHRELDGVMAAWFERHDCKAAIVRPDHYVYATLCDLASLDEIVRSLQERMLRPASQSHLASARMH